MQKTRHPICAKLVVSVLPESPGGGVVGAQKDSREGCSVEGNPVRFNIPSGNKVHEQFVDRRARIDLDVLPGVARDAGGDTGLQSLAVDALERESGYPGEIVDSQLCCRLVLLHELAGRTDLRLHSPN